MKYREHNEAMRNADARFHEERDKRYSSENELRAMALRIKETADAKALDLASQIQNYKDDRTEKTREQSLAASGTYVTQGDLAQVFAKSEKNLADAFSKLEVALKPMIDHIAADKGGAISMNKLYAGIIVIATIIGAVYAILNYII